MSKRSRLGPILFGLYLLLYGTFVLLAAFSPATMDRPIAGINLAVWFGFGLIGAAVIMALIYGMFAPVDAGDTVTGVTGVTGETRAASGVDVAGEVAS